MIQDVEILKTQTFFVEKPKLTAVHVSVLLVYRGNFNDERLIASREFSLSDLQDKPLVWLDLFLGMTPQNKTQIAFAGVKGSTLYILRKDGEKLSVVKKEGFTYTFSDDYDEGYIIATNIW